MKSGTLIASFALATFAAPVFAAGDGFLFTSEEGGYALSQERSFDQDEDGPRGDRAFALDRTRAAGAIAARATPAARVEDGFHYVAGDTGWEVSRHVLVLRNGRLVHSDECDHAIRNASATVTPAELDRAARSYPGA